MGPEILPGDAAVESRPGAATSSVRPPAKEDAGPLVISPIASLLHPS